FDYGLRFEYSDSSFCENFPNDYASACSTANLSSVRTRRPDGALYSFTWDAANNRWKDNKPTSINYIVQLGNGNWELHTEGGSVEPYKPPGVMESIINEHGVSWTFNYAPSAGGLQSVTHSSGRSVQFTWEWSSQSQRYRVHAVTDPSGQIYTYSYDPTYTYLN